jgi:alkanesulfonate monooxygenase SsuD/methylene tetrahydromethanopterin reductase-like flavin-dependent oxidoreductase (luciferase family)
MIAKAAQVADRIILNLHPPQRIKRDLAIIDEACSRAGGKPRPNLSVMLYSYVLGDGEKGTSVGKDLVAFYASAPAYSSLFTSLGYESEAKAMTAAWKAKDRDAVKRVVTSEMVKRLTVLGTIQDLRERVQEYHQNGVDDVFIAPSPFGEYEANVREVLQHYF